MLQAFIQIHLNSPHTYGSEYGLPHSTEGWVCLEIFLGAKLTKYANLIHIRFGLPPLKWSSVKYDFRMEDKIDGKEEAYG
jgi:hypothetical protein